MDRSSALKFVTPWPRDCGYEFRILEEVMEINELPEARFLRKVRNAQWTIRGKRLDCWGCGFFLSLQQVSKATQMR